MNGEALTELITSLFLVLIMAGLAWSMKAAGTGQLKRNAWIGIRTASFSHCDECWLLGHHAAAHKGIIGCVAAAVIIAAGGVAALLAPSLSYLQPVSLMLGVLVMLGGLLLGMRDGNTMLAKMHTDELGADR